MSNVSALMQGCCNCGCVPVSVHAALTDGHGTIDDYAGEIALGMDLKDEDCQSRSTTNILTPLERSYPTNPANHGDGDAAVTISVHTLPSGFSIYAWRVQTEDGSYDELFSGTPSITIEVNWSGTLRVTVYLIALTPDANLPAPPCAEDYTAPKYIRLTKPATIDWGVFDDDWCPEPDAAEQCRGQGVPRTADREFVRMGAATIDLKCEGNGQIASHGSNSFPWNNFGTNGSQLIALQGYAIGQSPVFTYRVRSPRGVCASVMLRTFWVAATELDALPTPTSPGIVGAAKYFKGMAHVVISVDLYGTASDDSPDDPWRKTIYLERVERITDYQTEQQLWDYFSDRPEYASPNCDTYDPTKPPCIGNADDTALLPLVIKPPNYVWPSDSEKVITQFGGTATWFDDAGFSDFVANLGFDWTDYRTGESKRVCGCQDMSVDFAWLKTFGDSSHDPWSDISSPATFTATNNHTFGFSVEEISAAEYERDAADCPCIEEMPEWPSGIGYKLAAVDFTEDGCELSCELGSVTVDAFPQSIELTLPPEFNLDGLYGEQAGIGGFPCEALIAVDYSGINGDPTAYRHADWPSEQPVILEGTCGGYLSNLPANAFWSAMNLGAVSAFNEVLAQGNFHRLFYCDYAPTTDYVAGDSYCRLVIGYHKNTGSGDASATARFYTACVIKVNIKENGGGTSNYLYFYAFNYGPEFTQSDYTETELKDMGLIDNPFDWIHDWNFTKFYQQTLPLVNFNQDDDPPCNSIAGAENTALQYNCNAISFDPTVYEFSAAAKEWGKTFPDQCETCVDDWIAQGALCADGRANLSYPIIVSPTYAPAPTEIASTSSVRPWLRVCLNGSGCDS